MAGLRVKERRDNGSSFFTENNPAYLENSHQSVNEPSTYIEMSPFSIEEEPRKPQHAVSSQEKVWRKTKKCSVIASVLITVVLVVVLLLVLLVFGVKIKSRTQHLSMEQELALNSLSDNFEIQIQKLNISLHRLESQVALFPVFSCATLPPSSPSGYYWVRASNGSAVLVYCDMTRWCGGVTGGWTKVFELDMTNGSQQCPSGLRQRNDSNLRTCIQVTYEAGCSQVILLTSRLQYSRVCGRIQAYQVGSPDTFDRRRSVLDIDDSYVDGVSLTHGNPRQHIWTFAAGHDENGTRPHGSCPCLNNGTAVPPLFVGNDFFCDTGSSDTVRVSSFYSSDPLWDGAGCGSLNTCCSFNTPPWFYKQLPQPTIDDIEMRVCRDESLSNEDIAVEMIEIYIQ